MSMITTAVVKRLFLRQVRGEAAGIARVPFLAQDAVAKLVVVGPIDEARTVAQADARAVERDCMARVLLHHPAIIRHRAIMVSWLATRRVGTAPIEPDGCPA